MIASATVIPSASRTTPGTRIEIARSTEPISTIARRYGISAETVRKWRKLVARRTVQTIARSSSVATNFPLDDLTFVVCHFLPHLNCNSIWRILKATGLNRRPKPSSEQPFKGQGTFRYYGLGFVHIDIKHLPKLQTANDERRKRYFYVAVDRCSRSVHLAVKDDETERVPSPSSARQRLPSHSRSPTC